MGAYIPPADTTGVDDIHDAWDKCPANCKPLLIGDLNINFGSPRFEREEIIVDSIEEINLANFPESSANGGMVNREGDDGPGGNREGDSGTNHSQTTAWLGMEMQSSSGMLRYGGLGSTTRIIEPSSQRSRGDDRDS